MSDQPATSAQSETWNPTAVPANSPVKEGTDPVPVLEHKYKKKRPIYDSDLRKSETSQQIPEAWQQVLGILAGIAFAYGAHQIAKYIISLFAKKCCALPEIPTEVPLPTSV
jgi:hypothetical protein